MFILAIPSKLLKRLRKVESSVHRSSKALSFVPTARALIPLVSLSVKFHRVSVSKNHSWFTVHSLRKLKSRSVQKFAARILLISANAQVNQHVSLLRTLIAQLSTHFQKLKLKLQQKQLQKLLKQPKPQQKLNLSIKISGPPEIFCVITLAFISLML